MPGCHWERNRSIIFGNQTLARLRRPCLNHCSAAPDRLLDRQSACEHISVQEVVAELPFRIVLRRQCDELPHPFIPRPQLGRGQREQLAPVRAGLEWREFLFNANPSATAATWSKPATPKIKPGNPNSAQAISPWLLQIITFLRRTIKA